jgi:hypothetical protein
VRPARPRAGVPYPGAVARHSAPVARHPGDLLVRAGAAVFVVGLAAVLVIVVPFLTGSRDSTPLPLALTTLALPAGFGLALLGLLRGARSHRAGTD